MQEARNVYPLDDGRPHEDIRKTRFCFLERKTKKADSDSDTNCAPRNRALGEEKGGSVSTI